MKCPFQGSYVAIPTPFTGGTVDRGSLIALVDFHTERGTDGLVVAGTSGEGPTLSDNERQSALETVVAHAAGELPVLVGVGASSTAATVQRARAAAEAGADGLLVATPPYVRPNPRGLLAHFGAVAEAVDLPIVLYNNPGRAGCDLGTATVGELRGRHPNIVAIKEASGTVGRGRELLAGSDIALFAGEDALIAEYCALGATGVIGVVGNLAPRQVADLCRCARPGGDAMRAAELEAFLHPLVRDVFLETNPAPLKAALAAMGLIASDALRLPLVEITSETRERLMATLHEAGLLQSAGQ